jgi:Cu/Ag efflux protein CusF
VLPAIRSRLGSSRFTTVKSSLRPLFAWFLIIAVPAASAAEGKNCGCNCCKDRPKGVACCCHEPDTAAATATPAAAAKADDGIKRHPLKGVITSLMADKSSLMVKHEEIPDVMRAMTMMFKVDEATLKSVKPGQTITGLMSRQGNAWVLENVKVVPAK